VLKRLCLATLICATAVVAFLLPSVSRAQSAKSIYYWMRSSGFEGSIILHALKPVEAKDRLAFVRSAAPAGYV
jgi:hypothetical protein